MKPGIHAEIHQKAKATCSSCDSVFEIPTTVESITVEKCRNCHPVYTGKEQQAASGGRVERFRKRMAAQKKDK